MNGYKEFLAIWIDPTGQVDEIFFKAREIDTVGQVWDNARRAMELAHGHRNVTAWRSHGWADAPSISSRD